MSQENLLDKVPDAVKSAVSVATPTSLYSPSSSCPSSLLSNNIRKGSPTKSIQRRRSSIKNLPKKKFVEIKLNLIKILN